MTTSANSTLSQQVMTQNDLEALAAIDIQMPMGYKQLKNYLPHRYPFMLLDRVVQCRRNEWIHGYKNVTINEPFFQGHFPEDPIMPGVLMVEAMAQLAGVLIFISKGVQTKDGYFFLFGGVDKVRFKKIVVPGDQLMLSATLETEKREVYKFSCQAKVGDKVAASAQVTLIRQYHADKDKTK